MSTDRLTDVPLVSGIVVYWVVRSMWDCRAGCSSWPADASSPSAELLRQPVETGVVYRAEYLTCDQWRIKARSHRNRPKLQQRDHACNYRIFCILLKILKRITWRKFMPCLSQVGVLSKPVNESSRELSSTYPTLCCKEIRVPTNRVLPSGSLYETLNLENFVTASRLCCQQKPSTNELLTTLTTVDASWLCTNTRPSTVML